ncbi:MAG TPA: thioredoxin family protein [Cyclobacteriaceae bacterium]|nr:thioredoxin family protein [Cyclobacteriaceae bacterium]
MEIKVLGTGCPRCKALEQSVMNVLAETDIVADVSKVGDIAKIIEYGVIHTPALVINGKIVLSGRVPSGTELKSIITSNQ